MRVVLYADDMEPITVIELSGLAEGYLKKHGMARLPVMLPPMISVIAETQSPTFFDCKTVTIFRETFIRHRREHMMLFTFDEESAMLLKCAFLPGQQAGLQERERTAFARGFLEALAHVGNV
jgi:hypothetical protein